MFSAPGILAAIALSGTSFGKYAFMIMVFYVIGVMVAVGVRLDTRQQRNAQGYRPPGSRRKTGHPTIPEVRARTSAG